MHDAIAEASLEVSRAAAHAFAKPTEVILETAPLFSPLDRPPLQKVTRAEFAVFRGRSQDVPAANARSNDQNTARELSAFPSEEQTASVPIRRKPAESAE